jgi:hypothetical protein
MQSKDARGGNNGDNTMFFEFGAVRCHANKVTNDCKSDIE